MTRLAPDPTGPRGAAAVRGHIAADRPTAAHDATPAHGPTTPAHGPTPTHDATPTHGRRGARDEAGAVVLWLLGLCVVLLFIGGLSLDLWRAFGERRALAGAVDAAAVAGASGIDADVLRATGQVVLDPPAAEGLAAANLAAQTELGAVTGVEITATPTVITVTATGAVDLTLTRVLLDPAPLTLRVTATAGPHRSP